MRALILAAGRGSRMGSATDALPKGLVELAGRPLIAWQLAALCEAGVRDVAIVRGYRAEAFDFDVAYIDNARWNATTMVGSLACAADWIAGDTTIVSYADLVYPAEAIRALAGADGDVAVLYDVHWLALWRRRFAEPLDDAETFAVDERCRVTDIGRRPASLDEVRGQYMGLLRLTPRGVQRLLARHAALPDEERARTDLTGLLRRAVEAGEEVRAVPYTSWWCEVDRPSDLAVAEALVAERARA